MKFEKARIHFLGEVFVAVAVLVAYAPYFPVDVMSTAPFT